MKKFGSELLFLGVGVGPGYFVGVLPRFLLYILASRSRKCSEKFSSCQVLCFLGFVSLCLRFPVVAVFFVVVFVVFSRETALG